MEQNLEQNQSPFPTQPTPRSGNIGALAAAVVIVLLLAAGGFYFFYDQQQKEGAADAAQALQTGQDQDTMGQGTQSDSTTDIESDLNATQTSGADASVSDLEQAL